MSADLAYAGYTYHARLYYLLDCAPSLDSCVAEMEAGLAFARHTGGEQVAVRSDRIDRFNERRALAV